MKGILILEALLKYGPIVFDWVDQLRDVAGKDMTPEEVVAKVASLRKSYDDYLAAERAKRVATPPAP